MRSILAALCLACAATTAVAGEPLMDGPVVAGGFGMGGSDYYGDIHARLPFTREEAPRPIGIADMERRRAEAVPRRAARQAHPHRD